MDELQYDYTELDIAGLSPEELKSTLSTYDIVLVEGGNPFYLLQVVRETGFQQTMEELMRQGVTYIGKSAGSYIACPSLIVSTWSQLTFNKFDITDLSAMHRVDFFVKAHYTPEMAASLQSHAQELTAPLYALTNDQALVIDGEKMEWIGGGDEVVFGK